MRTMTDSRRVRRKSRPRVRWRVAGPSAALLFLPASLGAHVQSRITATSLPKGPGMSLCSFRQTHRGGMWNTVLGALGSTDPETWLPRVRALEDSMATAARQAPSDPGVQYLYAVALGARVEVEKGKAQLHKAEELYRQVERVLALDPDHAGALYIQGRLNAAVMRLNRIKRFIATKLLGGAVLSSASWEEARRLLEAAAREDPCVPDHHLELARVYAETGDPDRAREELDLFFVLLPEDDRGLTMGEKGRALLRTLGSSKEGRR